MSATRLPGKPLLKINNLSIISHVVNKVKNTEIGRVVVCTEDQSILEDVEKNGGEAVLTGNHHKSGTDRIFEGYQKLNIEDVDYILNVQGDEPLLSSSDLKDLIEFSLNNPSNIINSMTSIKEEIEFLGQSNNEEADFIKLWTKKEAVVKLFGGGISMGLANFSVLKNELFVFEEVVIIEEIDLQEGFAHVAFFKVEL